MPSKRKANQDNEAGPSWKKKVDETSSDDDSAIDCTDKEKELLDYVLERDQMAVFEMFNILASNTKLV